MIALCLAAAPFAAAPHAARASQIAYWAFDNGTANDSIGGHNGTLHGDANIAGGGKVGSGALYLDGSGDYVDCGGATSDLRLLGTSYTIAWWANWGGATSSAQRMINMHDGIDYSGGYSSVRYAGGQFELIHNMPSGSDDSIWKPSSPLVQDTWVHLAVVYDIGAGERRFYVDGAPAGTKPAAQSLASDDNDPLWFGAIPVYGQYYKGALDDIRIYDQALTVAQINLLPGLAPPTGDLTVFKFNDLDHDGIYDHGQDGHPGTEELLSGWDFTITGSGGPYYGTTGLDGSFTITGLSLGSYSIDEMLQPNWTMTTADPMIISVAEGVNTAYVGNYYTAPPAAVPEPAALGLLGLALLLGRRKRSA